MGQPDLYPFVLAPKTIEKLAFIHALTHAVKAETPRASKAAEAVKQGVVA